MEIYEYIICGAGIAGLYSALNLIEKNNINPKKILIIEKSYRVGGLIQTNKNDKFCIKYENGAGRFTENDELLKNLIKRFGLQDKIIKLDNNKEFRKVFNKDIIIATYGYAISCHKAQGQEWDNVYIDASWLMPVWNHAKWFYTAITRAKSKVEVTNNKYLSIK